MEKMYNCIFESASRELTKREIVQLKNFSTMTQLDDATKNGDVNIDLDFVAVFKVHNEKAQDKQDYVKYVFVDKNGDKYITGSESLYREYLNISEEMEEEDFGIIVTRSASKNYPGRDFLTCTLL